MNYNGYVNRNSIIHKMNPSLKFISAILFIVMIFIPFGFFFQIILSIMVLGIYFLAKLPLKKLLNIFKSILVMMAILLLVNWFTYKGPGVIFDIDNHVNFLIRPGFLSQQNANVTQLMVNGKQVISLQGYMWGGTPINGMLTLTNVTSNPIQFTNGFAYIEQSNLIPGIDINTAINNLRKPLETYKYIVQNNGNGFYLYVYQTQWFTFSSFALTLMLYVSIKVMLMIIIVTILTSTTSSVELTYALEDILNPLRIFKLPVTIWSTTIALGIRFIPSLLDESNRILKAQASRGLDFVNGNLLDKAKSLSSLIVPLFSIAFKKADELANAMEARGYDPKQIRTRFREYKISVWDWIFFALICLMLGFFIAMVSFEKTVFISPLGLLESIIMFGRN